MKNVSLSFVGLWCMNVLAGLAAAQTPVVPPVVRQPVVAPAIVTERVPARVVEPAVPIIPATTVVPATTVATRPLVRETVVAPARTVTWWDAFGRMSYGFYDDGFSDDNWFYDYYEVPAATVAVVQPVSTTDGTRTSWRYDPQVEQRLFRW
jgi:hypothetical protein